MLGGLLVVTHLRDRAVSADWHTLQEHHVLARQVLHPEAEDNLGVRIFYEIQLARARCTDALPMCWVLVVACSHETR